MNQNQQIYGINTKPKGTKNNGRNIKNEQKTILDTDINMLNVNY